MQRSLALLNTPLASTSGRSDTCSVSSGHFCCLGRQHQRVPLQSRCGKAYLQVRYYAQFCTSS